LLDVSGRKKTKCVLREPLGTQGSVRFLKLREPEHWGDLKNEAQK